MSAFKCYIEEAATKYINESEGLNAFERSLLWEGFVNGALFAYQNPNIEPTYITPEYLYDNDFNESNTNLYHTYIKYKVNDEVFGSVQFEKFDEYWNMSIKTNSTNLTKRVNTVEEFISAMKYCVKDINDYYFSFKEFDE